MTRRYREIQITGDMSSVHAHVQQVIGQIAKRLRLALTWLPLLK